MVPEKASIETLKEDIGDSFLVGIIVTTNVLNVEANLMEVVIGR